MLNFDDFGAFEGAKIIKIQQNIENFRFIHLKGKYLSDFDDFSTIRKPIRSAFEWYQNHQNPTNIGTFVRYKIKKNLSIS